MRPTDDDDSAYFCSTMNSRNRNNWIRKFKVREISTLCGKCKAVKLAQLLLQETNWHAVDRTDMTFFTLICCKNCIVCFKRPKINKKEAGVGPFKKNKQEVSCTCWVFSALGEAYLRSDDVVATKSLLVSLPFYGIFFLYWWDTLSSNSSPLARLTSCA